MNLRIQNKQTKIAELAFVVLLVGDKWEYDFQVKNKLFMPIYNLKYLLTLKHIELNCFTLL